MSEFFRIHSYFVFGAIGGLTGWFLSTLLLLKTTSMLEQAIYGAILGAMIGLAIAAHEGFATRSAVRLFKFGSVGLILGAISGVLALPSSQWLYGTLVKTAVGSRAAVLDWKSIFAGMVCWILFGGLIGFVESLNKGTQSIKGFSGGVLGGVIGGGIYELARGYGVAQTASLKQQVVLAVSLSIVGGAIGGAIAFVSVALKRAWIEVLDGKFAGRVYDVTKYVDPQLGTRKPGIIGSDEWRANVYLPGDHKIQPAHAKIGYIDGRPSLTVFPEAQKRANTLVNGNRVTSWALSDGDKLQIGQTLLVYRQKRR